ncbi:MAG: HIT family protein [bacterium]|nr:HIT family protein [bacterium]
MTTHENCLICDRIRLIKDGNNPYFVRELKTGYVVVGDHQFFRGYTLFLCKEHKRELHELDPEFREDFLWEMSEVASAVFHAFQPQKLNYELLGNTDEHMHWHLFPRHENDPEPKKPVWSIDKSIRFAESARPTDVEIKDMKIALCKYLDCK